MHAWTVVSDPKSGGYTHTLDDDAGRSMLAAVAGSVFRALQVSASLFDGRFWWPIHSEPNLAQFEVQHGKEGDRWSYNTRQFEEARRRRSAVRGEHAGCSDLFVPIVVDGHITSFLIAGPFKTARPTSIDVIETWRWLTGRQGHPADPAFAAYLGATLATLVLEGANTARFERLLGCLADLFGGRGRADALTNRAHALRLELESARSVERTWQAVRLIVDERSGQAQYSAALSYDLRGVGLARAADHVLVGLTVSRVPDLDPVEDAIRRDAFQRASVGVARAAGDMIAGQVGDYGVVFLSAAKGSASKKKQKLLSLAGPIEALARRRFGLSLHLGISQGATVPLSRSYQAALGAAESALIQGAKLVTADPGTDRPSWLRHLRDELRRVVQEQPRMLPARFDRFLEVVSLQAGSRVDPARAHLEICFERIADVLLASGILGENGFRAMRDQLDRDVLEARTLRELFAAYRRAVADLSAAVERPVPARQDSSLRVALDYVHQHYGEPLRREKVARMAGFTGPYFSQLFRKKQRKTFERYVLELRLARAEQLLSGTDLTVTRIAELSGHRTPHYLCRVFRNELDMTPLQYRQSRLPHWAKEGAKPNRR